MEYWKIIIAVAGLIVGILQISPEWFENVFAENTKIIPPLPQEVSEVRNLDSFMSGQTKNVRGVVIKANEGGGNLYFTLQDVRNNATIKGVLFEKTSNKNPLAKRLILRSCDNRVMVYLKGKINIYNDELQIITWEVFEKWNG